MATVEPECPVPGLQDAVPGTGDSDSDGSTAGEAASPAARHRVAVDGVLTSVQYRLHSLISEWAAEGTAALAAQEAALASQRQGELDALAAQVQEVTAARKRAATAAIAKHALLLRAADAWAAERAQRKAAAAKAALFAAWKDGMMRRKHWRLQMHVAKRHAATARARRAFGAWAKDARQSATERTLHRAAEAHRAEAAAAAAAATDALQDLQAQLHAALAARDAALARGQAVAAGFQRLLSTNMAAVQAEAAALLGDGERSSGASTPAPAPGSPAAPPAASTPPLHAMHGDEVGAEEERKGSPPPMASGRSAASAFSEEELGHRHAAGALAHGAGAVPPPAVSWERPGEVTPSTKGATLGSDPRSWYHRAPRDLAEAMAASDERAVQAGGARRPASPPRPRRAPAPTGAPLAAWSPARSSAGGGELSLHLGAAALEAAAAAAAPVARRRGRGSRPRVAHPPGAAHGSAADALRGRHPAAPQRARQGRFARNVQPQRTAVRPAPAPAATLAGTPSLALHSAVTEAERTARKTTYGVDRHAAVAPHELLGRPRTALQRQAPSSASRAPLVPRCAYSGTASAPALAPPPSPPRAYNPAEFQDE